MTNLHYVPAKLEEEGKPSPFSDEIPNLQVMWDSTSLGWLKRCPRYYKLRMLEGLETKKGSIHLTFGILYHEALEIYDRERVAGTSHDEAQRKAVDFALDHSIRRQSYWQCPNCRKENADFDAAQCQSCGDDKPEAPQVIQRWHDLLTEINEKGREQLVRAVVWYTETYKDDNLETVQLSDGSAAVELSFTLPLDFGPAGSSEHYSLRGHLDRLARATEGTWIPDRKTTKSPLYSSYFDGFSPGNQVTLYTLAGKMILGEPIQGLIIDAVQLGVSFSRFQRGYIHRTESQLEEWLEDLQLWLEAAERYAVRDHWPQNEEACGLYGGCPFREICGRSPEVREKYKRNDFVGRPWNPAEDR